MFGRRILVLIPHPDDEVVGCCAAVGRARGQGATVFGAYLTTGVPAAEQLWPWQRSRQSWRVERRRQEAERAAELLGLEPVCFQAIPTRCLKEHLGSTRERLAESVRRLNAEMLWAPAYEGGHQDHDAANFLASTFRNALVVWEFSAYNYAAGQVRSQEFPLANGSERKLRLDDVERQRKRELLGVYRSEAANLSHVKMQREVFRPLANYDYARPPHPGKLFYQRFQWVPYHPRIDYCQPDEVCQAIREFAAAGPFSPTPPEGLSGL